MNSNIKYCRPSDEEMNRLVLEWWSGLDNHFNEVNKKIPEESIQSSDGNYAFLYGHYDKKGNPSGVHKGTVKAEHRNLSLFAPLINGRYGDGPGYRDDVAGEDVKTGILLSQYVTDLYANILRKNNDNVDTIPQVHWISHELPKSHSLVNSQVQETPAVPGFYYGIWICIDGQQLETNDTLKFGGKGGPHVAALPSSDPNQTLNPNVEEWLPRFETHAVWTIGTTG